MSLKNKNPSAIFEFNLYDKTEELGMAWYMFLGLHTGFFLYGRVSLPWGWDPNWGHLVCM